MEVSELEKEVRRLRTQFNGLVGVLVFAALGWYGLGQLKEAVSGKPRIRATDQQVVFSLAGDGPYVITHLEARGGDGSTGDFRWTPLNPPVAVLDSAGAHIDLRGRKWFDYKGEENDPPARDAKIRALYYQPERVEAP